MHDPYVDPETGVLRNRLGVTQLEILRKAEDAVTAIRTAELEDKPLPGAFDLGHLQQVHRHLFGDIYAWAGELRTVDIAKGARFCPFQNILTFAEEVFARLSERNHLKGLERGEFVVQLADLYGDINALHPFREGNGRTQRAFCSLLARNAGWRLEWSRTTSQTNLIASIASFHGEMRPLEAMMHDVVTDPHA